MTLEKWGKFFRNHLPLATAAMSANVVAEQRLPYRVVTLCRTADAIQVEQLIRQQLGRGCTAQYYPGVAVGKGNLTNITVEIRCSIHERADVVRLVTRLGLEKCVRSVMWESIPKKLAA
ncbi:hypothetical protein QN360_05030 [Glaciimonas sp. CA11.2]|uniref:hypothetical protein n=1 Tax=Glaciimonas sp. CA11.2 TaxID=3048601 RepID=UPI002AB3CA34|nr:hypothetical protein [Glaciimonas sp. CA11.2]MDY7546687.1 hypothetical protein [Glaciimonas sp. CA11.2]MEB0162268.1 hypothetical protein [Glaciimonas sp. CA11.2]